MSHAAAPGTTPPPLPGPRCPACRGPASPEADRCPHCGHPIKRGFLGRAGGERAINLGCLIFVAVAFLLMLGGCPMIIGY